MECTDKDPNYLTKTSSHSKKRKKVWKIKYNFFVEIIKSDSPIFCIDNKSIVENDNLEESKHDDVKSELSSNINSNQEENEDYNSSLKTHESVNDLNIENKGLNLLITTKNEYFDPSTNHFDQMLDIRNTSKVDISSNNNKMLMTDRKCSNVLPADLSSLNSFISNFKIPKIKKSVNQKCPNTDSENVILNYNVNNKNRVLVDENEQNVTNDVSDCTENRIKPKFKKPQLPVNKRPPTRRSLLEDTDKRSSLSSFGEEKDLNITPILSDNSDLDVISIYASSNLNGFVENKMEGHESQLETMEEGLGMEHKKQYTEAWISKETSYKTNMCWEILKGGCRAHWCKYNHKLPKNINHEVTMMNIEELTDFTNYIKGSEEFLYEMLPVLISRGNQLKQSKYVISLIGDVLSLKSFDKTPQISLILDGLKNEQNCLENVIQEVLNVYGKQSQVLCDILLSIVTSKNEPLINNWSSIRILVKDKNDLDFGVVSDMLEKCVREEPTNITLMSSICEDILMTHNIPMDKIDWNIMNEFLMRLKYYNMCNYMNHIVQQNKVLQNKAILYLPTLPTCSTSTLNGTVFPAYFPDESPPCIIKGEDYVCAIIKKNDTSQLVDLILNDNNKMENVLSALSNARRTYCSMNQLREVEQLDGMTLNVIVKLCMNNHYAKAYEILQLHNGKETVFIKNRISIKGFFNDYIMKYILLIRIYFKNYLISKACQLLTSKDWNFFCKGNRTLDADRCRYLIEVSKEFFQMTSTYHLSKVKEVFVHFIEKDILIKELDIWMVFNKLLQNLLRDRNQKEELWSMLNIVKMYHINIHKDILRMMLIVFYDDFADCQRRQFYEICKNSGLYVFLMANETLIELPKNLTVNEAELLLSIFFENRKKLPFSLNKILIRICDPMSNGDLFLDMYNNEIFLQDIYRILINKIQIKDYAITIYNNDSFILNLKI